MSSNTFSELFGTEREVELAALMKLGKGPKCCPLPDRVLCGVRGRGTTRDLGQRCVLQVGGNLGLNGQSGEDLPRPSSLTLLGLSFFARAFRMAVILFSFSSTGRLS